MFISTALLPEISRLRRFAMRLTRNDSDADDLVQSTLVRTLEKQDFFKEGSNLFSWASKIMFNLFATQYRRKTKFETQYDPEAYIDKLSVDPSQENTVDMITVNKCMQRLSAKHRNILVYVCAMGMSYEEVALALKIPVGTVRSRLNRARINLQELLAPAPVAALPPSRVPPAHMLAAANPLSLAIA
jgi:RNA polymerase sigma-70 factor (ECF subfamily)